MNPVIIEGCTIHRGDSLELLKLLPAGHVQCCVTSPPYWGLRDYGVSGQMGLEKTPDAYIKKMVELFREVRRVLRDDGTLWLNIGDCYAQSSYGSGGGWALQEHGYADAPAQSRSVFKDPGYDAGIPNKNLVGIPWMLAFALRADGWYLRMDIIWSKPNPMPESVLDRPTKAHEYIFLMTKKEKYYYDAEAIREKRVTLEGRPDAIVRDREYGYDSKQAVIQGREPKDKQRGHGRRHAGFNDRWDKMTKEEQAMNGRNKRSVWEVPPKPFKEAHFATYPVELVEPCILAGCPGGGIVLDPFFGAGTTGVAALKHGRQCIGLELNPEYIEIASKRILETARQPDMFHQSPEPSASAPHETLRMEL